MGRLRSVQATLAGRLPRVGRTGAAGRGWTESAEPYGWRSVATLVALLAVSALWVGWPIWDSATPPSSAQLQQEAPWVAGVLVLGLVLLAVAMWRDAGGRADALSPIVAVLVGNTGARILVNPYAGGIEVVHALPLLAGMSLGAPAGFLVGAGSALTSTAIAGTPSSMLPTQAMIWGISGMLGGLLRHLRPVVAWLCSWPLAVLAGLATGVLLNLPGWSQTAGTTTSSFFPGLPPGEVLQRLWGYMVETSLVYDLTRGATTALLLALFGLPLLRALRREAGAETAESVERVSPAALDRRADGARINHIWTRGDS